MCSRNSPSANQKVATQSFFFRCGEADLLKLTARIRMDKEKKISRFSCISDISLRRATLRESLTLRFQDAGDVELPLRQEESLFQVLLVASGPGQGKIHKLWPERAQDGQEGLSTSPAGPKVPHTDGASNPGGEAGAAHKSCWYCGNSKMSKILLN